MQWISQGFGGGAPNKLEASAEGRGASFASDPCRRHGRKLVSIHESSVFFGSCALFVAD